MTLDARLDAMHDALTQLTQDNLELRRTLDDIVAFATHRARVGPSPSPPVTPQITYRCGHTEPAPSALPYLCLACGLGTLDTRKPRAERV